MVVTAGRLKWRRQRRRGDATARLQSGICGVGDIRGDRSVQDINDADRAWSVRLESSRAATSGEHDGGREEQRWARRGLGDWAEDTGMVFWVIGMGF